MGDGTPRNNDEIPLGDETLGTKGRASPTGKRGNIDASPASLGGRKPRGTSCWRARQHRPPQIPLGDETPRNNPLASAASLTAPQLPLGGETLRTKEELPLGDKSPGTKEAPAGDRGNIDAAPASLRGRNPEEQPTGECGYIDAVPASLGGQNPEERQRPSPGR